MTDIHSISQFIWQIAELLRGPYRPPQYERVMLPLTVLRRFDCVLAPTKQAVLAEYEKQKAILKDDALDRRLNAKAEQRFHNRSKLDFAKLLGDHQQIDQHLLGYINGFSKNVRDIFEKFEFFNEIQYMHEQNILYLAIRQFAAIDLHPSKVDNYTMGLVFEDLIRRFNEAANETAGDHFTPREVIQLMVDLLFQPDDDTLSQPAIIKTLLDPTCGTGGMLSEAQRHIHELNAEAKLYVYGQDINPRSYAVAASDLLIKGNENSRIELGDTLTQDQFPTEQFDYFLANPPFGVDWKRQQPQVKREHAQGAKGRFVAGLPRVNDGSLLFLQHMIAKFQPYAPDSEHKGSRMAIVLNGSPLFTGGAGSGESEIRKWIIANDYLEAIIAMPEQMFYNTGIGTYIWILSNRKIDQRKGKVQLIDARERYEPLRRSLGSKRRQLSQADIAAILAEYAQANEFNAPDTDTSKIFDSYQFGYNRVPIERPLRLAYRMQPDKYDEFIDQRPYLRADLKAIRDELQQESDRWSDFEMLMKGLLKRRGSSWKAPERKLFADLFTENNPEARPVVDRFIDPKLLPASERQDPRIWGWFTEPERPKELVRYLPDSQLRDFEQINHQTLTEADQPDLAGIAKYVRREVLDYKPDAWANHEETRSAFEINFNRYFYRFTPPRPLAAIDSDLRSMEEQIVSLLREVMA